MGVSTQSTWGVNSRHSMRILALLFIAATSSAKFSKEGEKPDGGLYFDEGEVALACTVGTGMGAKLSAAMENCVNTTGEEAVEIIEEQAATTRKKKPCRSRRCRWEKFSKKCPSVQNIKKKIGQDMKVNLCILNKLGWVDAAGDAIKEVMVEDIKTLPSEVTDNLSKENMSACAEKITSKMSKHHERCAEKKKYSSDDVAQLSEMGLKAASYKCFHKQFAKSCQEFVRKEIYAFYKAKSTPALV